MDSYFVSNRSQYTVGTNNMMSNIEILQHFDCNTGVRRVFFQSKYHGTRDEWVGRWALSKEPNWLSEYFFCLKNCTQYVKNAFKNLHMSKSMVASLSNLKNPEYFDPALKSKFLVYN